MRTVRLGRLDQQRQQGDQREAYDKYRPVPGIKAKKPTFGPDTRGHGSRPPALAGLVRSVAGQWRPDCCAGATTDDKRINEYKARNVFVSYQTITGSTL